MKLFLDTASLDIIQQWITTGIIDGITTNPSHLSKESGDPTALINEIISLMPDGTISVEVTELEENAVYRQAHAIAQLGDNIAVKIPCHERYYPVIHTLVQEKIQLNSTLVFTLTQALAMSKLGVAYISPFVGRLEDLKPGAGIALVADIATMLRTYAFKTKIIAASMRSIEHIQACIQAGAHCITVPPALLKQAITHTLTDTGMEQFGRDWHKKGWTNFPQ